MDETLPLKTIKSLPDHCYKRDGTRRIWRTILRFLNVVEPGPEIVISWSRLGMALAISTFTFVTLYLTLHSPANLAAVIGAAVGAAPFVFNYIHQRMCDTKTGGNPNSSPPPDGS